MKLPRRHRTLFFGGAACVFAALSFVSWRTLGLERAEREAQSAIALQDAIGLALYRMDFWIGPVIAAEAARVDPPLNDATVPLPPFFRGWLDVHDGGAEAVPAVPLYVASPVKDVDAAVTELAQRIVDDGTAHKLWLACEPNDISVGKAPSDVWGFNNCVVELPSDSRFTNFDYAANDDPEARARGDQNAREFQNRAWSVKNALQAQQVATNPLTFSSLPSMGRMSAIWTCRPNDDVPELWLTRRMFDRARAWLRVIPVDWTSLASELLKSAPELPAGSTLKPILVDDPSLEGRRLASLPAIIETGPPPAITLPLMSGPRSSLAIAWIVALGAFWALGRALDSSHELSERRGRFVSAVTHELRTPLTTFRMYSEMLADGMIQDESMRREYLETLRLESSRLARVVESVLLFSRLEDGRRGGHRRSIDVQTLIEGVVPALARRASEAGLDLLVRTDGLGELARSSVRVDPQAIEQILFNLVDNACKYGRSEASKALELTASASPRDVRITVQDHGCGVPEEERSTIFEPFHRGARHGDGQAPGVGLGLAVARGLAEAMRGRLEYVDPGEGSAFRLTLPWDEEDEGRSRNPR